MSDIEIQIRRDSSRPRSLALGLVVLVTACTSSTTTERADTTRSSSPPLGAAAASSSPSEGAEPFPVSAFANISASPVSEERSQEFRAALDEMSEQFGGAGMAATVMSADGTWGGTAGKADGVREVRLTDQFNIGSISKSLVAAQVMLLVEAGEMDLDDPVAQHLPADLDFDTNGATIRQLLSHRSGIPDYWTPELQHDVTTYPRRAWTTGELLASIPEERAPVDVAFEYSSTNYVLLGLAIEHRRGQPLIRVLRNGVLDVPGTERLISQPQERPSAPMAMPFGESIAALKEGGGYLPSTASVTTNGPGAVMASDAPSLARWWRAFCAGEIVSQDSLTAMATFVDGYGFGLFDATAPYADSFGHAGSDIGYISWAGCLPDSGSVVVTLSNTGVEDIGLPRPLVVAAESAAGVGSTP